MAEAESPTETERSALALVTVGVPLGVTTDVQTGEKRGMLRHGTDLLNMDRDAYQVLLGATWSMPRAKLAEWATSHRHIADAEGVIDRCLEAGLLIEIDFGSQPRELWPRLRLQAIGVGMGPDENDRCRIEVPLKQAAEVDRYTYSLWGASDGRSLQAVADALADAVEAPPEVTTTMLPLSVFRLLSQGAAYLDKAP